MKIMVTGGAGFIGSNVVDGYVNAGHDVVVVDNLYSGKRENLNPRAKFCEVDIRSEEVERVIKMEKPEVVNHHAAQINVRQSVEDPVFDAEINVIGTLNLLELSLSHKVKRFIFASTCSNYGKMEGREYVSEDSPLRPVSLSRLGRTMLLEEA